MSPSPPPPFPPFLQTRYLFHIQLCFFYTAVFFSSTSFFGSSCDDFSGDDFERRLKVPPPLPFLFAGQHGLSLHCHHQGKGSGSNGRSSGWMDGKTGELLSTSGTSRWKEALSRWFGSDFVFACVSPTTIWAVFASAVHATARLCAGRGENRRCRSWVKLCSAGSQPARQRFPVSITGLAKVVLRGGDSNNDL